MSMSRYPELAEISGGVIISQTAEYALRAVVYLADQGGAPRTTKQIAEVTQVPGGYLSKVMQTLSRAGVVNSQRGLRGGFTLVSKPDELSILTIINAIDPILRFPECPLGIPTHGKRLCPLHSRLDQAGQMIEDALANTTVSELLAVPARRKPLCRFPTAPVSK